MHTDLAIMDVSIVNFSLALSFGAILWLIGNIRDPIPTIPGPFLAKISRLWIIAVDLSGQRTHTIHDLHQKYGPVVRIGPREVSFASEQAMRDIYGANNQLIKAPIYEAFGRPSSFTIRMKTAHRARQKRIAHVFAPAAIAEIEPLVHEQVAKLIHILETRSGQMSDVMELFRIFALDVVGAIFLGKSFGGLDQEQPPKILQDLDDVFPSLWVEWQFAPIRWLLLLIPSKHLQHFLSVGPQFYQYGKEAFDEYISRYGRTGSRRDLLTKLIAGNKDVGPLADNEIVNEMTNLIFAGTDTTSNTFSYLLYRLAKHPHWQRQLQTELSTFSSTDIPHYRDVKALPILDAIVHETLRVHPAAPASLQRIVPVEGSMIDGVNMPGKSIVSCQSYTTHRDPHVYANPDTFDPSRWLERSEEDLELMHGRILVWGKGQRACLGRQLAYMELKIATAAIARRFNVELSCPAVDEDMEMTDHFTLIPKGKKCILKVSARQDLSSIV